MRLSSCLVSRVINIILVYVSNRSITHSLRIPETHIDFIIAYKQNRLHSRYSTDVMIKIVSTQSRSQNHNTILYSSQSPNPFPYVVGLSDHNSKPLPIFYSYNLQRLISSSYYYHVFLTTHIVISFQYWKQKEINNLT